MGLNIKSLFSFVLLLFSCAIYAQDSFQYKGVIKDVNKIPVSSVNIQDLNANVLAQSDSFGVFSFKSVLKIETLVFKHENYLSDTLNKFKPNNIQVKLNPLR